MKRTLAIGAVTAVLLTYVRGSFVDAPWVPFFFALTGVGGSLLFSWLLRRDTLQAGERFLGRGPHSRWLRDLFALAIAVSLLFWSGPVIISAGFSGWLVALFISTAAPLTVCLMASRWCIALGILTATCIAASILLENAHWSLDHGDTRSWANFWAEEIGLNLLIWGIAAGLSLIVSVPIHLGRRRAQRKHVVKRRANA